MKHRSNKRGSVLLSVFIASILIGMMTEYFAFVRAVNIRLTHNEIGIQRLREKTDAGLMPKLELIDKIKGYINLYESCSSDGELDVYKDRLNRYE